MRQQEREFTVADFSRLCNRKTPGRVYPVPIETNQLFLDRCVANGLVVTTRCANGTTYYRTTQLVAFMFGQDDEG